MTGAGLDGVRVLLTGGTGFIGSEVARVLLRSGARVQVLTSSMAEAVPVRLAREMTELELLRCSLDDGPALRRTLVSASPDRVIHMAGFTHVGRSFRQMRDTISLNVQGTVNLLEALQGQFDRFVYIGSGDVYGDAPVPLREDGPVRPLSPYAVSKYAAERFCRMFHQAYGWPITCLRPFNVYGPGQSADRIIPELITAGLQRRRLSMTEGRQTREFTYVADVADAFVRSLTAPGVEGEVINIGSGREVAIRDLALKVLAVVGEDVEPLFGALDYRPTEVWRMFADVSRAGDLLDWSATTTLDDGLRETVEWYRSRVRATRFATEPDRSPKGH